MAIVKEKARMGRPPKEIEFDSFEKMCFLQATADEIASALHISKPQLYEKVQRHYGEDFPTIYKRFSSGGKMSLRRSQYRQSEKSAAMAIWLGKQYLGQTDTIQQHETPQINLIDLQNRLMALEAENAKLKALNDIHNQS